jgi:hypothetical protein
MPGRQDLLTLVLRLDTGSEPLRGRVEIGGESVDFVGWVGLAAALDRALAAARGEHPSV